MMKKIILFVCTIILLPLTICANNDFDVYKCVDNEDMKIALTFDDGPHAVLTNEILDILDEYDIKATFFVVGENIDQNPDVLRRIADSGHEIGNHTESHIDCAKSNYRKIKKELASVHERVLEICDYDIKLFRPPGGAWDKKTVKAAHDMVYSIILWSVDTKDWAHTDALKIADNIHSNIKSGSIILFHDYISKNSPTPTALRRVIPELLDKGYSFVTVGELIDEYGKV